jgi:tyrosyl-tRNA synthetase
LGHTAILIIGDFTAMIGDPTGKSKTRPQLTLEDTRENGQSYLDQAELVLITNQLEVKYNSEWLNKMNFADVISLAANYTVAQLLERDDFSKRYKEGTPISVHELLYPLAQAMDSAAIMSDVELGGTDQKFNLMVGRDIQRAHNQEPQCILTMPILEGTDGKEKMSKSLDNYIGLTDKPFDMFGKVMSIPDELILRYYQYGAFASNEELELMKNSLVGGENPRNAKVIVAKSIVDMYYPSGTGQEAFEEFERVFKNKDIPDDIADFEISENEITILDAIFNSGLTPSKKEARRVLEQGGVSLDGEKADDPFFTIDLSEKRLLKVGKRKFIYLVKK